MSGKRIASIDIAKGVGMMFIMWGHIMRFGITNHWVYVFHIPLFFFLSGLVFSYEKYGSFRVFLKRKFHTLLIPYFIYSVVTWVIWALYSFFTHADIESYWMPLLQTFIAQGSAGYLIHNGTLWFVTCLFVVECLYWMIGRLKIWIRLVVLGLCAVLGVFLSTYNGPVDFTLLPWNIEVALMVIIFYAAGDLLKTHLSIESINDYIKNHTFFFVVLSVLLGLFVYVVAIINGKVSMGHANPGKYPLLFYFGAFCGTAMTIIVSAILSRITRKNSFIEWVGKNSFCVMAIHNPIKGVVVVVVARIMHTTINTINSSLSHAFIAFVFSVIVTAIFTFLISRIQSCHVSMKHVERK